MSRILCTLETNPKTFLLFSSVILKLSFLEEFSPENNVQCHVYSNLCAFFAQHLYSASKRVYTLVKDDKHIANFFKLGQA